MNKNSSLIVLLPSLVFLAYVAYTIVIPALQAVNPVMLALMGK